MTLPKYYRYFSNEWNDRPLRTPVLPENIRKNYENLTRTIRDRKVELRGKTKIIAEVEKRCGEGHIFGKAEPVLVLAIGDWLAARAVTPGTRKLYLSTFGQWIRATGLRRIDHQGKVGAFYLQEWRDWHLEHHAPRTTNTALQVLRSWYSYLRDLGWIQQSPWRKSLLVRVDRARLYHANRSGHVRRYLTEAEGLAVLDWAAKESPTVHAALCLLALSGLRRGEAVAAGWDGLHDRAGRPHLTITGKGNRTRIVAVEPRLGQALAGIRALFAHAPKSGPILRKGGKGVSTWSIGRWVREAGGCIGRDDLTPHELRRSFATWLRQHGAGPTVAQRALGHARLQTTQDYYDLSEADEWPGGLPVGKMTTAAANA